MAPVMTSYDKSNPLYRIIPAMSNSVIEREQLLQTVNTLPDEVLAELASFLDYLRYKTHQNSLTHRSSSSSTFLSSITGLGKSGQIDTSERDEQILKTEVHPLHGWHCKPNDSE